MVFTIMSDVLNNYVISPLDPQNGGVEAPGRAIGPTFPTFFRGREEKRVNPYHSYVSRGRLSPVFQRTRPNPPNNIAFRFERISPVGDAYSPDPFLWLFRNLAYWLLPCECSGKSTMTINLEISGTYLKGRGFSSWACNILAWGKVFLSRRRPILDKALTLTFLNGVRFF